MIFDGNLHRRVVKWGRENRLLMNWGVDWRRGRRGWGSPFLRPSRGGSNRCEVWGLVMLNLVVETKAGAVRQDRLSNGCDTPWPRSSDDGWLSTKSGQRRGGRGTLQGLTLHQRKFADVVGPYRRILSSLYNSQGK